jgi:hypothetical protein
MDVVIKISSYDKEWITNGYYIPEEINMRISEAIANGIPLPKGHGRLIILSEDAIKREQMPLSFSCQNWISEVGLSNATVAIIEADKDGEE